MAEAAAARGLVVPLAMGEVVEASTTHIRAVARTAFEPPPFGSFVRSVAQGRTTYAVVSHAAHTPLDPSRRAVPLGRPWEELLREHPQIAELLVTEFDGLIVAYAVDGELYAWLPPTPPRVHDFVYACGDDEVASLTEDLSFVRTLAAGGSPLTDELVAAAIRCAAAVRDEPRAFLVRAGREVAALFRQDYERARSILRRCTV